MATEESPEVVNNLAANLEGQGWGRVRTGKRRTVATARKIAKDAAERAGVEVTTSDKGDHLEVTVK